MLMCQELTLINEPTFRKRKTGPSPSVFEGPLQLSLTGQVISRLGIFLFLCISPP